MTSSCGNEHFYIKYLLYARTMYPVHSATGSTSSRSRKVKLAKSGRVQVANISLTGGEGVGFGYLGRIAAFDPAGCSSGRVRQSAVVLTILEVIVR